MSCPVTPGGHLKRELTKTVNRGKEPGSILVIEDGGKPVHCGLRVNDPMRQKGCIYNDPDYIVSEDF